MALIIGACLALSSTAIVVEVLSRQGRLNTSAGRASFAVLLAQDLAVAPLLLFISIFGAGESGSVAGALLLALANAAIALGVIVIVGRVVMRPLFRLVASAGMSDLFVATTLFVIVAAGVAAAAAGFSMALGAFVAGLLLAETEFRKAIETAIDPFKGLLLGLFFFTVGMNIDFRELARDPVWLLGGAIGLIAVKSIILIALARLFRLSWRASIETGLLLGPGGEFAFVGIGMATTLGLIDAKVSSFTVALTSLTMLLIPACPMPRGGWRQWCAKTSRSIPSLPLHRAAAPTMPLSSDMAGSDRSSAPCSIGTNSSTLPSTMTPRPCRSSAGRDAPSITVKRPIRSF